MYIINYKQQLVYKLMLALQWRFVFFFTGGLYALTLLCLPISGAWASFFLFALIAFWSRLPAMGMPNYFLFFVLYSADFVDIFSAIIAVNMGGPIAVVFSVFCNLSSRLCGVYPSWKFVGEDTIAQAIVCMIIPFFHAALGGNIFITVIVYTILRIAVMVPINFFTYGGSLAKFIIEWSVGCIIIFVINSFYGRVLGDFFSSLLTGGVSFSWILFLIATACIITFYIYAFGVSPGSVKTMSDNVKKLVKKRILRPVKAKPAGRMEEASHAELDEMERIKRNL